MKLTGGLTGGTSWLFEESTYSLWSRDSLSRFDSAVECWVILQVAEFWDFCCRNG